MPHPILLKHRLHLHLGAVRVIAELSGALHDRPDARVPRLDGLHHHRRQFDGLLVLAGACDIARESTCHDGGKRYLEAADATECMLVLQMPANIRLGCSSHVVNQAAA